MEPASPTPNSFETGWLDGWRYDSILIFGVALIALISGLIVLAEASLFYPVLIADLWLLGYHHVIATFTKLAGTAEDRAENFFLIYLLPLLVLGGVVAMYFGLGIWSIVTVYFFWQWFHYTRQAYGIGAFYRRKAKFPTKESRLLTHAAIWSIPIWGLLNRTSQGWEEFLFLPVYMPPVPERVAMVAGIIAVGTVLLWIRSRIKDFRAGQLSIAETSFVASHMLIFYVGYIAIADINIGWLVANVWHNAQYILFVWLYNTNRFKNTDVVLSPDTILQWLSKRKPVRILLYFCFTLVLTTIFYQFLGTGFKLAAMQFLIPVTTLYVIGYQAVNFHHYVVDGIIWKARNRKNQQVLNVGGVEQ